MSTHVHEGKGSLLHWSEGSETEEEAVPQGKFYFHVAWPGPRDSSLFKLLLLKIIPRGTSPISLLSSWNTGSAASSFFGSGGEKVSDSEQQCAWTGLAGVALRRWGDRPEFERTLRQNVNLCTGR